MTFANPTNHTAEPDPPENLPDYLRPIWTEMAAQVRADMSDAEMEALCTQVYRMRDAAKRITEEGIVVADPKGNPVPHPALAIEKQAQGEVRTWLAKYGAR